MIFITVCNVDKIEKPHTTSRKNSRHMSSPFLFSFFKGKKAIIAMGVQFKLDIKDQRRNPGSESLKGILPVISWRQNSPPAFPSSDVHNPVYKNKAIFEHT